MIAPSAVPGRLLLGVLLLSLPTTCPTWAVDRMNLTPFSCCDGRFQTTTVANQVPVWQSLSGNPYFYFDVPSRFTFKPGLPVHVEVTYYNQGSGSVGIEYDSTKGDTLADAYRQADQKKGGSRTGDGAFVSAYYELSYPRFAGRQNGNADFRLYLADGGTVPLSVQSVVIQNSPFVIARQDSVSVTPLSCCDGQIQTATAGGQAVWRDLPGSSYMYFQIPYTWNFKPGAPAYLQITYYDEGYGTVSVEYDSALGNRVADMYHRSDTHTRSSRVNSRTFVDSYHELLRPKFAGRQNGKADFRLSLSAGGSVPLSVKAVTITNKPFSNAGFQYALTKPWLRAYTGSTKDYVDRSTLNHKVMVGYQGWFRTPNDLADGGWFHWCKDGVMTPANFNVDMWPDLTGFKPAELFRAGEVMTRSGKPAYLFSSTTRDTVRRHFQWMRKYNIDGAFLQRFVHSSSSGAWGHEEWVLHHVREAANLEGRIWAIEYDVSSLSGEPDPLKVISTDWKWLVDVVKVLKDPQYAYERGKPVVFIWGLPYPDRNIPKATADAIVDFFRHDPKYGGNYVIGGFPWWWRTQTDWYNHFQRYNGALAWMPPDQQAYLNDYQQLRNWGMDYFPHAWPGFSWANLQHQTGDKDYTPRQGGAFLWQKMCEALGSGASRLFIGMFDEYDGTSDPHTLHPLAIETQGSGEWRTVRFEIADAYLGHRQDAGADFRLCVTESGTLHINRVWVRKE